ncbi:MAG: hypothetical protein IKF68_04240, partial [Erysipelotrichaceae bacterium]|nr:hypothetical protein [Erysipelotrichaceae bacterium]
MNKMKKKDYIALAVCFVLSLLIVIGRPLVFAGEEDIVIDHETKSLIGQKVLSYTDNKHTYDELYYNGQLVGVINDMDVINRGIDEEYRNYEEEFPDTALGLSDDLYIVKKDTCAVFEDRDEAIMQYLLDNSLLGIRTNAIEFSTANGVYDIIYVNDLNDFYTARDRFLLNFVSQETLDSLRNSEVIDEPNDFGTV